MADNTPKKKDGDTKRDAALARATSLSKTDWSVHATPSFFCRLLLDVVYWNVKRSPGLI